MSPKDQSALQHGGGRFTSRVAQPGELLFEFFAEREKKCYRVELRNHGDVYGWEAQFLDPVELRFSRTFPRYLSPDRTSREMAIAWAAETRKASEAGRL
jgi:hypothetical protein